MAVPAIRPDQWLVPEQAQPRATPARVVALGGDGIGPEVVEAAVRCIEALRLPLEIATPVHGAQAVAQSGSAYPDAVRAAVNAADAVLFGAADTGPSGHCRAILRHLRFGLDSYANLRPAASLPGVPAITGAGRTNLVIVRELTEDMYPGCEGDLAELQRRWPGLHDRVGRPIPSAGKFALRVVTERASRRVARYAALLAGRRRDLGLSRGHVTIVGKANVLEQTEALFLSSCEDELASAGGLTWEALHVDEAARRLVAQPFSFDVILTTNLFGDILSDVAAEVMGGLPMAPSGSIGERSAYFEPCHGSAPDIVDTGTASPVGALLSAAMMLAYLGFLEPAERLSSATIRAYRSSRASIAPLSGVASALADQICEALS